MMDIMQGYHDFSRAVAQALNDAHVRPLLDGEEECCAVMVVVFPAEGPGEREPVGGALNWIKEKEIWEVAIQLEQPRRVSDSDVVAE
jgi:hypothetical protein